MNKKMKRLIAAGVIGAIGSKMGSGTASATALKRPGMREIAGDRKKNFFERILNMGPGINATSKKGGTLASKLFRNTQFGLGDMDGAKYGKMIKANKGTYVKASCKLGRNKPTKIT